MSSSTQRFMISTVGSPDVLMWVEGDLPNPGPNEIRIRHEAIGVNYIDVYHRTGSYPLELPSGIGVEGAGIVEAVGSRVSDFAPGDRVAYVGGPPGAYSTVRLIPAGRVVKVPDGVSSAAAASILFKGVTVEYLIRRCYAVQAGEAVLLHSAAGGIGRIACQWLKHVGATIIGTVGSAEKAVAARASGCDYPINYREQDFVAATRELTGGAGVAVAYDSVGKDAFFGSMDCLKPRGTLVSFGTISGPVPPFDTGMLTAKGSLYLTRPSVAHYTADRGELEAAAAAVFEMIENGVLRELEPTLYPLREGTSGPARPRGRQDLRLDRPDALTI